MRGVDLARFPFDFDLTFALLTMDASGGVYHRYGGRDQRGAEVWLTQRSLERVLEATLAEHRQGSRPVVPPQREPLHIESVPSFAKRDKGECIHCHSVNTTMYEEALADESFDGDWIWKHPPPSRIGIDLDPDDQQLVIEVNVDSAAFEAGLQVADRLLQIGATPIASVSDVMFALDRTPAASGALAIAIERAGEPERIVLTLAADWKRGTPAEFAWRPTKWALTPAPGFGGPQLAPRELEAQGLDPASFAFRAKYFVTWGDNRRYGKAALAAGLKKGDIIVSVGGKSDFDSINHFHAWWRLHVTFGATVKVDTLRDGERRVVNLVAQP